MSILRFGCLVLALFVLGCGSGKVDPNRPKTAPVSGTVTYKGQPVEGATVTFFTTAGAKGKGAVGKTDASGQFKLTTFAAGDGAIPGKYTVSISKFVMEGAPQEGAPAKEGKKGEGGEPFQGTMKDLVPAKYKDPSKSNLTADVPPDGAKDLKFELTD